MNSKRSLPVRKQRLRDNSERQRRLVRLPGDLREPAQRHQREIDPIEVVLQIEDFREAGAGPRSFMPRAIGPLSADEIFNSSPCFVRASFACRDQAEQRPRSLRGGRLALSAKSRFVVAANRFTPAAVALLFGFEPLDRAADARVSRWDADLRQAHDHLPGAVEVIDSPATVPAVIVLLILATVSFVFTLRGRLESKTEAKSLSGGAMGRVEDDR